MTLWIAKNNFATNFPLSNLKPGDLPEATFLAKILFGDSHKDDE